MGSNTGAQSALCVPPLAGGVAPYAGGWLGAYRSHQFQDSGQTRSRQSAYAVSKMGLITLTEVIAAEVKGTGVTANVILPSIIDTPANREAMPRAGPHKWVPPERIAATMHFLCSDAAASINGAHIPIYGAV